MPSRFDLLTSLTLAGKAWQGDFVSWSNTFPILDESMIEASEFGMSDLDRRDFDNWFGTNRIVRPPLAANDAGDSPGAAGKKKHVVAVTLFWKHVNGEDPELPVPTRQLLIDARRLGLVKRFSPWESYIEPMFVHSREAMRRHPHVTFRVYLASDLEFLLPELVDLGWEVHLMNSPSVRYCPGGFWRFLGLEESDTIFTIVDSDRIGQVTGDIERTELMDELGLSLWRVPGYYNADVSKEIRYRPILGGHFGARGGQMPVRKLIEAFVWHWRNNSLPLTARIPGLGERPIKFANWPSYGFDEWFQLAAMYPWLAPGGVLSFVPVDSRSLLLPMDIEYATWANPRSEVVYF